MGWRRWSLLAGTGGLLLLSGCRFGAPRPASSQAEDVFGLYRLFFYAALAVGGVVYALILYAALRYRRRGDALPKQTRYNIPIEVTYTAIPVLIVLALFALTFQVERRVDALEDDPAVVVNVTGFQWGWRFDYPDHAVSIVGTPERPPTMVVPVGQTVRVNLFASDVIHAFFVPEFLFKRDTIPGMRNEFDLVIPRAGTFRGECAEFCGLEHDAMNFFVKAVPPDEFRAWAESRRGIRA